MYDIDGNRIAEYLFDPATSATTLLREYVWMDGVAVAVIEGGQMYFIRTDHIGRPVFATDSTGAKVWEAMYLPFGGVHTTTNTPITLRFPGQWFDSESGLHQNWMRDYDPTTGRYMQADPLGLVDGASVYGYVRQNPGRFSDPRGEQSTTGRSNRGGGSGTQNHYSTHARVLTGRIEAQHRRLKLPPYSTILPRTGPTARTIQGMQRHLQRLEQQPSPGTGPLMCGRGEVEVYGVRGPNGEWIYFGITGQGLPIRQAQHGLRFRIQALPGLSGLSTSTARGVEQSLIMQHGGAGGQSSLQNIRNSISPNNPNFVPLVTNGSRIIRQNGP